MNLYDLLFGIDTYPESLLLSLGFEKDEKILDCFIKDGTIIVQLVAEDATVRHFMRSEYFAGETSCPYGSGVCFLTFNFPEQYHRELELLENATAGPVDLWEAMLFDFSERLNTEAHDLQHL